MEAVNSNMFEIEIKYPGVCIEKKSSSQLKL